MLSEHNCKHGAKINSDQIILIKMFHFFEHHLYFYLKDLLVKSN